MQQAADARNSQQPRFPTILTIRLDNEGGWFQASDGLRDPSEG